MTNDEIIDSIAENVKEKFEGEPSGHDWWHIYRVWKIAERIGEKEGADMLIVSLASLLHDIADWKFHNGDDTVGPRVAREILEKYSVPNNIIDHVCQIISESSFKGAYVVTKPSTLEGEVVQDADRLDAIGAIGIARTFSYGGHKGRQMYNPDIEPTLHKDKESYIKNQSHTVNHFYEKLLLLKDKMNTATAKDIAGKRHEVMEKFLEEFLEEWEGKV